MNRQIHTTKTIPQSLNVNPEERYKRQLLDLLEKVHNPKLVFKIYEYAVYLYLKD